LSDLKNGGSIGSTWIQGQLVHVTLSEAKGLHRYTVGFFTRCARSHRPEAVSLRENDILFLMLGTRGVSNSVGLATKPAEISEFFSQNRIELHGEREGKPR